MRGERSDRARKARIDAADRRQERLAKRIMARDGAARAAAARASRRGASPTRAGRESKRRPRRW